MRAHRTWRSTAQTSNTHATVVSTLSTADALWTNHQALRPTTGTDEDGDRWRRRRAKTETDEDGYSRRRRQNSLWERAKWQFPHSWRHPRVRKTELDTSSLMQPADSRAHDGCSSLCSPRSSRGTAQILSFLNLLSGKWMVTKRDSPLTLCQLVWQKTNYKTFGTSA